jgi:hypothetical protein
VVVAVDLLNPAWEVVVVEVDLLNQASEVEVVVVVVVDLQHSHHVASLIPIFLSDLLKKLNQYKNIKKCIYITMK